MLAAESPPLYFMNLFLRSLYVSQKLVETLKLEWWPMGNGPYMFPCLDRLICIQIWVMLDKNKNKKKFQLTQLVTCLWSNKKFEIRSLRTQKKSDNCPGLMIDGQNGLLPISHKLASKISPVWNYLGKCPCFEIRFLDNRVIAKWNLKKKKKKNCGTRVHSSTWIGILPFWPMIDDNNFYKKKKFHHKLKL